MNVGRITFTSTLALIFGAVTVRVALAQADMTAMARNSAANELGILEYCQSNGQIDGTAVVAQKTVIARLPAGGPTDAAESLGKEGTILGANGNNVALASMASKGNTTEKALCAQMASSVKQAVASNPAMSMPAMPGGMPSMPNGMPAVPGGMPTMPSTQPQ